ncbi:MAG TPA: transketolase [Acidobacteriaceae bacterium]|nr:transketolase [Acidobacteriaceae bacterium]
MAIRGGSVDEVVRQMRNADIRHVAKNLRAHAVRMVHRSKASHLGSCLSMADILACLYWGTLRIRPEEPGWEMRDRFILSKGHGAAILYATLAERGFFPVEELATYCEGGSRLTGHVTSGVAGVELSSGSLGHGLPVGCGLALAAARESLDRRCFVLLSDGELDEGSNWEAILFAPQHRLDNLTVIVDYNKIQSFGRVEDVLDLEPLADKFRAFRWAVREVDGHNVDELLETFSALPFEPGKPSVVIAHTVKGKGIDFMEDDLQWHYKFPTTEQMQAALDELETAE